MNKVIASISFIFTVLLAACSLPAGSLRQGNPTPGLSADEAATQVALLLTEMPTSAGQPEVQATPTQALPTVSVGDAGQETAEPAAAPVEITPTAPPVEATPTATLAPVEVTNTATAAPETTATGTATAALPTATQPPAPAFTPPAGDPRQRLGAPTSTDPMDNDMVWVWPTGSDKFSSAVFSGGSMAVTALADTDGWRMSNPRGREFSNLYLEATFRTGTCSGSDHYGLITRVPVAHEPDQGYLFSFTCDGRYSLRRWNGEAGVKGEMTWLINWTASSAIVTGSNQTNRMSLFTSGNRLILYANGTLLTEVKDAAYPHGYFGVLVGEDETDDLTIYVDEMSYWENPQP